MLRRSLAATLAVAALCLAACTQGEGPVIQRTRDTLPFSRIEAGAGVQVKVTIGPAGPIVVHAQENIQDKVTSEVRSDGTLRLEADGDFVVADPVVIEVSTPALDAIALSGGAAVEVDGLDVDAIELSLSGGSRATISGSATAVTLTARGGSHAFLGQLDAATVAVDLDGGAEAEVRATESVTGAASGGATLRVAGEASVQVETSGGSGVSRS